MGAALPVDSGLGLFSEGLRDADSLGTLASCLLPARGGGSTAGDTAPRGCGGLACSRWGVVPGVGVLTGLPAGPLSSAAGGFLLVVGLFRFSKIPTSSGAGSVGSAEPPNPSWRPHHRSLEASGTVWPEDVAALVRFAASSLTCCLAASLLDSCSTACCRARSSISRGGACRGRASPLEPCGPGSETAAPPARSPPAPGAAAPARAPEPAPPWDVC